MVGDRFASFLSGNLESATKAGQATRTVQYSPFNTPTSIVQGANSSTIVYGPNQDRIQHSDSNGRVTKYVGGIYEEVTFNCETQKIHYVGDMALFISKGDNTSATYGYEYLHRDHIGSIVALSKGAVNSALDVQWQANGAWGERRYQQWNGPLDNLLIPTSTARGFTDHEHLDSVGLIHMNGRVYDPELGRFLSADPFVQAPYNSQSYNRYSYVFNNPLSFTDPSGYQSCGYSGCGSDLRPGECNDEGCRARLPSNGGGGGADTSPGSNAWYWSNFYQQQNSGYPGSLGGWGSVTGSANFLTPVADACGGQSSCISSSLNELAKGELQVAGVIIGGEGVLLAKLTNGAKKVEDAKKAADALKTATAKKLGDAGEKAVRAANDIGSKIKINVNGRDRIPDGINNATNTLSEVKNVAKQGWTQQLKDYANYAQSKGMKFDLYVKPSTQLSSQLVNQINSGVVNLRYIP